MAASPSGCPADVIPVGPQVGVKEVSCLQADAPGQVQESEAHKAWAHPDLMLPRWACEGESSRRSRSESSQIATGVWVLWHKFQWLSKANILEGLFLRCRS